MCLQKVERDVADVGILPQAVALRTRFTVYFRFAECICVLIFVRIDLIE